MNPKNRPHPQNVPGPFYVVDGCCTACGVPEAVAPELFAWDGDNHCYVKQQPASDAETSKALRAIRTAEFQCIRYRGSDPNVLLRIAELGEPELCDVPPPVSARPTLRNHVTFDSTDPDVQKWQAYALADCFAEFLRAPARGPNDMRVRVLADANGIGSLEYAWFEENFHRVMFRRIDLPMGRWLVWHHSYPAVSDHVNDWIVAEPRFSNARWYSEESWATDQLWRPEPF